MKAKLKRQEEFIDVKVVSIEISGNIYRLSETIYGRLTINKISIDGNDDYIRVHPRSGNEIDIS
jgi:2-hydroxy-3-keto-5-methylthiopentenyl-1-phosphate phosphatase